MCNETVDKLQRATFLECGQWWSLIFCGAQLVHGSSLSLGQKKNSSGMYILCSESRLLRHLSLASESEEMLSQIKEMVVGKGVPILNNSSFQVILHSRCLFTLGQSTSLGPINSESTGPWDKPSLRHTDGSPQTQLMDWSGEDQWHSPQVLQIQCCLGVKFGWLACRLGQGHELLHEYPADRFLRTRAF